MATYSIKDLETLSGVKAHTIRIWEQRYALLKPKRTLTNIRTYDDEDLKHLLNVAFLNKNGIRISTIAKMTLYEINDKVQSITKDSLENSNQQQALTMAMMELNSQQFEAILQSNNDSYGLEHCILYLIIPFLEKLSLLWITGTISHVHEEFVYNIIRRKILAIIEQIQTTASKDNVFLYLMPGETQDILILLAKYFMKVHNFQTLYLGSNISIADLKIAYQIHKVKYIFTIITEQHPKIPIQSYLEEIKHNFPEVILLITGYQVVNIKEKLNYDNLIVFNSLSHLIKYLDGQTTTELEEKL